MLAKACFLATVVRYFRFPSSIQGKSPDMALFVFAVSFLLHIRKAMEVGQPLLQIIFILIHFIHLSDSPLHGVEAVSVDFRNTIIITSADSISCFNI